VSGDDGAIFMQMLILKKTVWETFRDFMGSGRGRGANNLIAHTPVGKGKYGIVWKATDPHAAEDDVKSVAIKIIHFTTPEQKQAILSEIAVLQDCTGEGIFPNFYAAKLIEEPAASFSLFQKPSKAIIIMELLEGEELFNYVHDNPTLLRDDIDAITDNIKYVVGKLHKKGYVHHDIRPENMYILDSGRIRLVDAGFTRRIGSPYTGYPSIPQTVDYSININSRKERTRFQELASRLFEPYVGGRGTVNPIFDKYSIYKTYYNMMIYCKERPIKSWEEFYPATDPATDPATAPATDPATDPATASAKATSRRTTRRRRRRRHSRRQH